MRWKKQSLSVPLTDVQESLLSCVCTCCWGTSSLFLFSPQISPHGRPRCGSGRLGVVAEKVPAARSSASVQGLSCIWARSGSLPLQVAGQGTEPAEGPQEHLGPSLGLVDYGEWKMDGGREEQTRDQKARLVRSTFNRCSEHFPVLHYHADLCKERKIICMIGDFPPPPFILDPQVL